MTELFFKRLIDKKSGSREGKALLSYALALHGVDYAAEKKYKNEYGKEFLCFPALYYNISHTETLVCAALSDKDIGVDCETLRDISDHIKIAKRFFTKNELSQIEQSGDTEYEFFTVWTKKESYVKYLGKGFAVPFPSFDVNMLDIEQKTFEINGCIVTVTGEGAADTILINGDTI